MVPSDIPSDIPSDVPSAIPSDQPSLLPSSQPSDQPSLLPSSSPSDIPSLVPSSLPSDFPSLFPSDRPSECEDEPTWISGVYDVDVTFSGRTCAQITANYCSLFLSDDAYFFGGKAVNEACCVCGGSRFQSIQPSKVPSSAPSLLPSVSLSPTLNGVARTDSPTVCTDVADWKVVYNGQAYDIPCVDIPDGTCDTLTESYNGRTAAQACCKCGGGTHVQIR